MFSIDHPLLPSCLGEETDWRLRAAIRRELNILSVQEGSFLILPNSLLILNGIK